MPTKKTKTADVPNDLTTDKKSCWEVYSAKKHTTAMHKLADTYVDFLTRCKTERASIRYAVGKLEAAGFVPDLHAKLAFRVVRGKTLLATRRGKRPLAEGVRLLGAHCDTPRLDLKQHPLYEDADVGLAKTHYYGGIRKHQWFGRPLALHGTVCLKDGSSVEIVLGEDPKDPVFTILDLLPHLAQKQSQQKIGEGFDAEKLNIVLGHAPHEDSLKKDSKGSKDEDKKDASKSPIKQKMLELLHERFGIVEDDFFSAELHAVPAGPARRVGLDGSMVGGYGQDDRLCTFAGLTALIEAAKDPATPEYTQMLVLWDREEVGSDGVTGAKSRFFEYCVEELVEAWEPDTRPRDVFMNTRALSTDVHAAIDPDWQELHEKLNAARFGFGPVFSKFTGHRGKYDASEADAHYVAWLRGMLDDAGVPWQMAELGKVDMGGGGTVAKYLAEYGMDIIDFGPAILSMHSPFEVSSVADVYATVQAFTTFLQSDR